MSTGLGALVFGRGRKSDISNSYFIPKLYLRKFALPAFTILFALFPSVIFEFELSTDIHQSLT
jgi:hypothetical protein